MKKIDSKNTSKGRKNGYRCDLCSRKFENISMLQAHHRAQHNLQPCKVTRAKQYAIPTKKPEVKDKIVRVAPVKGPTVTTRRTSNVPVHANTANRAQIVQPTKEIISAKVEFECPRCFLSFDTRRHAAQHIQEFHYANRPVPMNINPNKKELCSMCNRKVTSLPTHICASSATMDELEMVYICLGCSKRFSSRRLYYTHVVSTHSEGVETLFFPTNIELAKWKQDLEYQTNGRYSNFFKVDSKYYAHCLKSHRSKLSKVLNACPSLIMLQEFPKGIQVHYYSNHRQHNFKQYKCTFQFRKYLITNFLKTSDSYYQLKDLKSDDNDLYLQFKQLMESVVLDAAKLKKETLSVLYGHALEMTSLLTAYDDDDNMSDDSAKPAKRCLTTADIEKALEEPASDHSEPQQKKARQDPEVPPPMILNTFSLANSNDAKENKVIETGERPNIKVKDLDTLLKPNVLTESETLESDTTPSSFSDSFAVFLKKNCSTESPSRSTRSMRSSKPIRFTKNVPIALHTPPPSQQMNVNSLLRQEILTSVNTESQGLQDSPKTLPQPPLVTTMETRQRTNSVQLMVQNAKLPSNYESIDPSKTETCNLSDNKSSIEVNPILASEKQNVKPKTKNGKPKVDIKYEVKEQEDDCNILILKI